MDKPNFESAMTRRQYVTQSLAAGAALLGATAIAPGRGSSSGGVALAAPEPEPLFRFVQINDLHVQNPTPPIEFPTYKLANEKARWLVEALCQERFCPTPAFVIGLGDMIHGEQIDRLALDLATFKEMISPLRCPFYPVVGNHEIIQQEHSARLLKPYIDAFGAHRVNYTFEHGGIVFIAVNNGGGDLPANGERRRVWLSEVLRVNRDKPKIVLCHVPLIPLREERVLAHSFEFLSYKDRDEGMLPLIEEYSESVIAVLSGHLHLTGALVRKGITHLSLSGTASFPSDGAVVYEVFAGRIKATVKALPPDMARAAPTLHGRPRHERDFTDANHPTAREYQAGREDERSFVIELAAAKRPAPPAHA